MKTGHNDIKELRDSAIDLNRISDDLGNLVTSIDKELARLNVGVEAWSESLGYAKLEGRWGLAIRRIPVFGDEEKWPFNSAPRDLRVNAIKNWRPLLRLMRELTVFLTDELCKAKNEAALFLDATLGGNG